MLAKMAETTTNMSKSRETGVYLKPDVSILNYWTFLGSMEFMYPWLLLSGSRPSLSTDTLFHVLQLHPTRQLERTQWVEQPVSSSTIISPIL